MSFGRKTDIKTVLAIVRALREVQGGELSLSPRAGSVNDGASTSNSAGPNSPTFLRLPVLDTGSSNASQATAGGK